MEKDYIVASPDTIIVFEEDGLQVAEPALPVAPILNAEEQVLADAVRRYQNDHRRAQLNWRDIFEIIQSLGYRKVEQSPKPLESNGSPQDCPDDTGNEKPS